MKNYYKILELEKTAELKDIRKSYKRLALIWHPDRNNGNDTKFKENVLVKLVDNKLNGENLDLSFQNNYLLRNGFIFFFSVATTVLLLTIKDYKKRREYF